MAARNSFQIELTQIFPEFRKGVVPMSMREGKRVIDRILAKVDALQKDIIDAARVRARAHGTRFVFPDCETRYLPDVPGKPDQWHSEIVIWQLSLLFGEYISCLLAQKAAEGHCKKPGDPPCKKMAQGHMKMLHRFKKDLQVLVDEISEVEEEVLRETKELQQPSQVVAWTLGLRDQDPDAGVP
jgi:hypothetical protein